MNDSSTLNADELREDVKQKYREGALDPNGSFHFHTGRPLTDHLGYDTPGIEKQMNGWVSLRVSPPPPPRAEH